MKDLYKYLPSKMVDFFNDCCMDAVTEIRLRCGKPLQFTYNGCLKNIKDISVSSKELEDIFYNMCECSQNIYDEDISNGFITLPGGYRVGIGGDFFYNEISGKYLLRKLYSLNIRVPRGKCKFVNQENLFDRLAESTLIIGPPHSGKTSLIRLYAKRLATQYSICICDERREIFDSSFECDALQGIKKSTAISMATRTLNPQFIICDEIGGLDETTEILSAVNTGVRFICTAHGEDTDMVRKRPNIKLLLDSEIFKRLVILSSKDNLYFIEEITDV